MLDIKTERVMQWVGGLSMACHCAVQGKIPGQS
jgi:hypothetical protein